MPFICPSEKIKVATMAGIAKVANEKSEMFAFGFVNVSHFWQSIVAPLNRNEPMHKSTVLYENFELDCFDELARRSEATIKTAIAHHCKTDIGSLKKNTPAMHGTINPAVEKTMFITTVPLCNAS